MGNLTITADSAATGATGTRNTPYWTRTSLATHFMGVVPSNARGTGGTIPQRLIDIVQESMSNVEKRHKWRWRAGNGTITTTVGTATWRLSSTTPDFGKFLSEYLIDTADQGTVRVTTDKDEFRARQVEWQTNTGEPELAILEPDTALSEFGWLLRFVPTPSAVRNYRFDYEKTMAALAVGSVPTWPDFMFELWRLDCRWQVTYEFDKIKGDWKGERQLFLDEFARAVLELDNPEESQLVRIHDANGDAAAWASSGFGLGECGYPIRMNT